MGLALVVEGRPQPGHEQEWRRLVERALAESRISDEERARFREISIPGYQLVGAPRVGQDPAADAWIIERRAAVTPEQVAATLKEFDGYYVLPLVDCDGVPACSHGDLYEGIDETSFRGAFLEECRDVLDDVLLAQAWENKMPEAAVAYGRALLAAAEAAQARRRQSPRRKRPGAGGRGCFGRRLPGRLRACRWRNSGTS